MIPATPFILLSIIVFIIIIIFRYLVSKKNKSSIKTLPKTAHILLYFYIVGVLSCVFFPFQYGMNGIDRGIPMNIIPIFNTVSHIIYEATIFSKRYLIGFWAVNLIGNVLLFVPFGILVPMSFKKYRKTKKVIILGFMFSLSIELMQLLSWFIGNNRVFDIDDIILNTLGCLIGAFIYKGVVNKMKNTSLFLKRKKVI